MYVSESKIDIRTVDPKTVPDIRDIQVDAALPPRQRMESAIAQMGGNPYLYRCGGILVKTSFVGKEPLQTVLEDCLKTV